jgi:beta-glucosidase
MITPLLTTLYKAGVYTRPQVDATARLHPQEFIDLAQKAAEEAIVLLKNEANQLPIKPSDQQKIVVMGLTAVQTPTGGGGSSFVSRPNAKDILTALQETYGTENITHIPFNKDVLTAQQTASITNADKVIVAAGFLTYEESECFDRPWQLQHNQAQLIQKVSALNPNLTVILSTGAGVETESWVHKVPALIHALYLGETGADALAAIISGKTSPSGKLPFTMAKKWEDFASTANYPKDYSSVRMKRISGGQGNPKIRKVWSMQYKEGLGIGYRHFDTAGIDPQFPFGHGLSYAEFEYPPVSFDVKMNDGLLELSFRVRNISDIDGATTLQVYVRDLESTEPRPEKELKAFKKVFLQAGRSAKIEFQLDERAFQYYDVNQKQWTIEPGDFDILIGTSSDNIILGERITIE